MYHLIEHLTFVQWVERWEF